MLQVSEFIKVLLTAESLMFVFYFTSVLLRRVNIGTIRCMKIPLFRHV